MTSSTPSCRRRLVVGIAGAVSFSLLISFIGLGLFLFLQDQAIRRSRQLEQILETTLDLKADFLIARQYDYDLIELASHNQRLDLIVERKLSAAITNVVTGLHKLATFDADVPTLVFHRQAMARLLDQYQTTVNQIKNQIEQRQRTDGIEQELRDARYKLWQHLERNLADFQELGLRLSLDEQAYLSTRRQEYIDNVRLQINKLYAIASSLPDTERVVVERDVADYREHFLLLATLDRDLQQHANTLQYQTDDLLLIINELTRILKSEQQHVNASFSTTIWIGFWLVMWMIGSSAAIFIGSSRFINRYFTQPLITLTNAARRVAEGWRETPIPLVGTDEIGDLARSLARLTTSLNATIATLEERIQQRTAQLQDALREKETVLVRSQQQRWRERTLIDLSLRLNSAHNEDEIYRSVVDAFVAIRENQDRIGIYVRDPDSRQWLPYITHGYQHNPLLTLTAPPALEQYTANPFYIPDLRQHSITNLIQAEGSAIVATIAVQGHPQAILVVYRPQPHAFDHGDIENLRLAAQLTTYALNRVSIMAELQRARERAEVAVWERSTFLVRLDHDIRQPLNTIIALSELLREALATQTMFAEDIDKIRRAGRHLVNRFNPLLDSAKIEIGSLSLQPEPFIFDALLDNVLEEISPLIHQHQHRFDIERPAQVGMIVADLNRLRQILIYALRFAATTTKRGVITLRVQRLSGDEIDTLEVIITDTGPSLSSEHLNALLTPFAVPPDTTRQFDEGCGLALSRQLCELMGGTFEAVPRTASGVRFTIRIPLSTLRNAEEVSPPAHLPQPDLVLITTTQARVLQAALEQFGWQVQSEASLAHVLNRLYRPPAAILMDVPKNRDLVVATLQAAGWQDVPIIWLTDNVESTGSTDYAVWPGETEQVIQTVQVVLSRRSRTAISRTILVIDDEPPTRLMIRRALESDGWVVLEANNGQIGATIWRTNKPQLVIMDLTLPDVDGLVLLREVHADLETPVIVVSERTLRRKELELLASIGAVVLQKGRYRRGDLLELVRKLIWERL
ncbi:MAG: response regulator [Chloroflexus sp.]|uniref:response regulator n=1 Tax=Chloroflexus sp. TaxID=1904827 RepID=UPI00404B4F01